MKQAVHFPEFHAVGNGKYLEVWFTEEQTVAHDDPDLTYSAVYKVHLDKDYEYLEAYSNGEKTHFGTFYAGGD